MFYLKLLMTYFIIFGLNKKYNDIESSFSVKLNA